MLRDPTQGAHRFSFVSYDDADKRWSVLYTNAELPSITVQEKRFVVKCATLAVTLTLLWQQGVGTQNGNLQIKILHTYLTRISED